MPRDRYQPPSERKYRAVARFNSPEEAQRALRTKHGGFIMCSKIKMRLLM